MLLHCFLCLSLVRKYSKCRELSISDFARRASDKPQRLAPIPFEYSRFPSRSLSARELQSAPLFIEHNDSPFGAVRRRKSHRNLLSNVRNFATIRKRIDTNRTYVNRLRANASGRAHIAGAIEYTLFNTSIERSNAKMPIAGTLLCNRAAISST